MASLVTGTVDDPKPGEMWTKKNPDAEDDAMNTVFIEGIGGDDVIYKSYQSYLDNDDYGASQTGIDEFLSLYSKEDELDLDDFEFLPNSSNNDFPYDYIGFDEVINPFRIGNSDNNNNDDGTFSDDNTFETLFNVSDDENNEVLPKVSTQNKKRTKEKGSTTNLRKPKRNKKQSKAIDWRFLSRDYDTLFYPMHNGKLVPQVMTIAAAETKKTRKRRYIFELKHNNTTIDKEIESWTDWRRDTKAVKEWIEEINRMKKKYKTTNPTISNFLKALERSFTITKIAQFRADLINKFKQEMAICYVHFIQEIQEDENTNDHTWEPFKHYFEADNTNCEKLKTAYKAKLDQNEKKNKKRPRKFASNAFHNELEYVKDETFEVLTAEQKQKAKQQLAEMFDIAMPKSTADAKGRLTMVFMAKLKF